MARLPIKESTLKSLFGKSGNICAFPGCTHNLIDETNKFIGQLCHIESANEGGQRYNPNSNDEERRDDANLVLFCYEHHQVSNDVDIYTVERLKQIKSQHEATNGRKNFQINESLLYRLKFEMDDYWKETEQVLKDRNERCEYPIELPTQGNIFDAFDSVKKDVEWVSELVEKIRNTESKDYEKILDFEVVCLGLHNYKTNINLSMTQLEIKVLEEFLKTNPSTLELTERLKSLKLKLQELINTTGYVD